jgi:hypothetical protein
MNRGALVLSAAAVLLAGAIVPAMARPQYLMNFKTHYKTADGKPALNAANCAMCHVGMPREAKFNPYGQAFGAALGAKNVQDSPKIIAALKTAETKQNPTTKATFSQMIQADILPASDKAPPASAGGTGGTRTVFNTRWEPAFNGVNLDGWTKENGGTWMVSPDGVLKYTGGGKGWLRYNKPLTNYSLVMTWRFTQPTPTSDAGLFLKAKEGDRGNPFPRSPQLSMGPGDDWGSLLGQPKRPDLMKRTDWNTYQITVQDGAATLAINNQVAWPMAVGDALGGPGFVGLQVEDFPLEIQGIWIMPLP